MSSIPHWSPLTIHKDLGMMILVGPFQLGIFCDLVEKLFFSYKLKAGIFYIPSSCDFLWFYKINRITLNSSLGIAILQ